MSKDTVDPSNGDVVEKRGGARVNAGRPKGSKNKRTIARETLAQSALGQGVTPLEVLLHTMRKHWKNGDQKAACEIAKDVAPYLHPRLSAIDTKLDGTLQTYEARPVPVEHRDSDAIGKTQGTA